MSSSDPLLDGSWSYLSVSSAHRAARFESWCWQFRSASLEESLRWRNKCASMLRRIRRITDASTVLQEDQRMQAAIEEYSIQTGLDYDQSKQHVVAGEQGGTAEESWPSLLAQLMESAATPGLPELVTKNTSLLIDPAFSNDKERIRGGRYLRRLELMILSQSMWMVVAGAVASYLMQQTLLPGLFLGLLIVSVLPCHPYPKTSVWVGLLLFELVAIGLKLVYYWGLPILVAGRDWAHVVPDKFLVQMIGKPIAAASTPFGVVSVVALELSVIMLIVFHILSLWLTGRLGTPPKQALARVGLPVDSVVSTKPIADLYTARFLLSLTVVVLLIIDWARISSTNLPSGSSPSSLLGESVTRNHFSTGQVTAVTGFIFQMLLDRVLYSRPGGGRLVVGSVVFQLVLLLLGMNLRVAYFFWGVYFLYLVLSLRQLAFAIRQVGSNRGGLLWSPGTVSYYAFRTYLGIPFLDELRQICDWVAAPVTALSLFMWFKVEDCMQNLRIVQAEMDSRKTRSLLPSDRAFVGLATLVGLVAVITGPLVFFSGLNVLREPNLVVSGSPAGSLGFTSLKIFLEIPNALPRIELYSTNQVTVKPVDPDTVRDDEVLAPLVQSADLQLVSFPEASDSEWTLSLPLKEKIVNALASVANTTVTAQWTFAREFAPMMSVLTSSVTVPAGTVTEVLQNETSDGISVAKLFPRVVYLDSTSSAKIVTEEGMASATSLQFNTNGHTHAWWSMGEKTRHILCLCERSIATASAGNFSISVIGLYIGVVLTIGRFLRLSLQGSSKRMQVEELPNTRSLMELCQGIQIARFFKDIETEKKLYYDLVRFFRDPQLLLATTGDT